jgi:hypothetical protein
MPCNSRAVSQTTAVEEDEEEVQMGKFTMNETMAQKQVADNTFLFKAITIY